MVCRVRDAIAGARPSLSFEFFPPKDPAGETALASHVEALASFAPDFLSVTYGAGGAADSRLSLSVRLIEMLASRGDHAPMAHLTCVGHSLVELAKAAQDLRNAGAQAILALRGDPPGGLTAPWTAHDGGLPHAVDLVRFLRELGWEDIGVAAFPEGHPTARSLAHDTEVLGAKAAAGAGFAITQMVFDPAAYTRMAERFAAAGVQIPVLPGIMPVTAASQVPRLETMAGAPLPGELRRLLDEAGSDAGSVRKVGVMWAARTAELLLSEGAPGVHLYTLNRSSSSIEVCRDLGLENR